MSWEGDTAAGAGCREGTGLRGGRTNAREAARPVAGIAAARIADHTAAARTVAAGTGPAAVGLRRRSNRSTTWWWGLLKRQKAIFLTRWCLQEGAGSPPMGTILASFGGMLFATQTIGLCKYIYLYI